MEHTTARRSHRGRLIQFSLLLLIALGGLASAPAQAQVGSTRLPQSPHSTVSSDGYVPATLGQRARAGSLPRISPAFAGSGTVLGGGISFEQWRRPAQGGQISPASVIGSDGRSQVTATTTFPYRAIAHITSSIGGCTGWFIGANTVVTAGHCVYGSGGFATNVRVYPGRSGSSTPYGSCGATRLFAPSGWTSGQNRDYDYGAIKLDCTVGNTTGWFGLRPDGIATGQQTSIAGYPGDKTYGTQWTHVDQVRLLQTRRVYYANDTYGGQSGSPVWNSTSSCSTCAIAVHAYGVDSTGYNGGTRITQEVYNNLITWRNS